MSIEIKISKKPIEYLNAIKVLEKRQINVINDKKAEFIWILEHPPIYTGGVSYDDSDLLDKKQKVVKTNRGGKITYHGPGQIIFYFVINLNKRKKDIRWFINVLENTIIETLCFYKIKSHSDRKNVGVWVKHNNKNKKIAALGIKVKKWVAYHGFSLNINTDLNRYKKIIPCGLKNTNTVNLKQLSKKSVEKIKQILIKNFLKNLNS